MSTTPSPTPGGASSLQPIEVQRSELGRVGAIAWAVLAVLLAADVLRRGHGRSAALALVVLGLLSVGVYALSWRPELMMDQRAVTLVNPFRTVRIPWSAVTSVGGSWSLEVRTELGTYAAWASGPRRRKRRPRGQLTAPTAPDETRISRRVIARWEESVSAARSAVPSGETVDVSWDRPAVAGGVVLGVALVGLLVSG